MTKYAWPTWADIIGSEITEFHNYAHPGSGNMMISNQILEQAMRYNFDENDLILVMWSTVTREDRYIQSAWRPAGNIYTQDFYNRDFVGKYACPRGYLIRDLNIMTYTHQFLNSIKSDKIITSMSGIKIDDDEHGRSWFNKIFHPRKEYDDVYDFYAETLNAVNGSLMTDACNDIWPEVPCTGLGKGYDYHPDTETHGLFLQKLGVDINSDMQLFIDKWQTRIDMYDKHSEVGWHDPFADMDRL